MATLKDNYGALIEGIMGKTNQELSKTNSEVRKNSDQISSVNSTAQKNKNDIALMKNTLKPITTHINYAPRRLRVLHNNFIKDGVKRSVTSDGFDPGFGYNITEYAANDWNTNGQYLDTFVTTRDILKAARIGIPFYWFLFKNGAYECIELQLDFDRCYQGSDDELIFRFEYQYHDNQNINELRVSDVTAVVDGVEKTFANFTLSYNTDCDFNPVRFTTDNEIGYASIHTMEEYYRAIFDTYLYFMLLHNGIPLYIESFPITGANSQEYRWPEYDLIDIVKYTLPAYTPDRYKGDNWWISMLTCVSMGFSRTYNGNLSDKVLSDYEISPTWNDAIQHGFFVIKRLSVDSIEDFFNMNYDNLVIQDLNELEEGATYSWVPYRFLGLEIIKQKTPITENLDLSTVPSTAGEYKYVCKCTVTVNEYGSKTPVYTWELET